MQEAIAKRTARHRAQPAGSRGVHSRSPRGAYCAWACKRSLSTAVLAYLKRPAGSEAGAFRCAGDLPPWVDERIASARDLELELGELLRRLVRAPSGDAQLVT